MRKMTLHSLAVLALLAGIHPQARAEMPQLKPLPATSQSSTPLEMDQTLGVVRIVANQVRIGEMLKRIHERSGIQFLVFATVGDEIVSGDFIAADWPTAIEVLLRDFNRITIWDDHGKPQRIVVLSVKSPSAPLDSRPREAEFSAVALSGSAISPNRPAELEPELGLEHEAEPEPEPRSGTEPEAPGDGQETPQYSTLFDFQGGIPPSSDDVQRFHDQNPPLSPEDIAMAEME